MLTRSIDAKTDKWDEWSYDGERMRVRDVNTFVEVQLWDTLTYPDEWFTLPECEALSRLYSRIQRSKQRHVN